MAALEYAPSNRLARRADIVSGGFDPGLVGHLPNFWPRTVDTVALLDGVFRDGRYGDSLRLIRDLDEEIYLVGGAIRDAIAGVGPSRDIDLMVPNDDVSVHGILGSLGPSRRNRHGNWRYFIDGGHIDVIEPHFFYGSFARAEDAIAFFDTSVNAVGVRLRDGLLVDPLNGVCDLLSGEVTLPVARWTSMTDFESVHLVLRLLRLLSRIPLRVVNPTLALGHVGKFDSVDWFELERLNGVSRDDALRDVERLLAAPGVAERSIGRRRSPSGPNLEAVPGRRVWQREAVALLSGRQ